MCFPGQSFSEKGPHSGTVPPTPGVRSTRAGTHPAWLSTKVGTDPFGLLPRKHSGELSDQGPRRDGEQRGVVWLGRDGGHHGLFLRKTQTINKVLAGRLTQNLHVWVAGLTISRWKEAGRSRVQALRPGGRAGCPQARVCSCSAEAPRRAPPAAMALHPSFLLGGSAMWNLRALGHRNPVATKDNVQEDQMRHEPGTKLSYEHTINR